MYGPFLSRQTPWSVPHSFLYVRDVLCFSADSDNLALISLGTVVVLLTSELCAQVGREDFSDVFQVLAILSQVKHF